MIFVNYRRADTQEITYAISERLARRLGADMIFLDVDNLEPGKDFSAELNRYIGRSIVMLVIIGENWLKILMERKESEDFVLLEIEKGLQTNMLLIPVLIDDVDMPSSLTLPDQIRALAGKQARRVTLRDFGSQVDRLVRDILPEIERRNPSKHRDIVRGRFGKDWRAISDLNNEIGRARLLMKERSELYEQEIAKLKGDKEFLEAAVLASREAMKSKADELRIADVSLHNSLLRFHAAIDTPNLRSKIVKRLVFSKLFAEFCGDAHFELIEATKSAIVSTHSRLCILRGNAKIIEVQCPVDGILTRWSKDLNGRIEANKFICDVV